MKFTVAALALLCAPAAAKVDWLKICTDAGDVPTTCEHDPANKLNTFRCLGQNTQKAGILSDECYQAVFQRSEDQKQIRKNKWKSVCKGDIKLLCSTEASEGEDPSQTEFACLSEHMNTIDAECLEAMQDRQRVGKGPKPPQAPPKPAQRVQYPYFNFRVRSAREPTMCLSDGGEDSVYLAACDQTSGTQTWRPIPTNSGYTLSYGSGMCLSQEAKNVRCSPANGAAFFGLERKDDHSVLIRDLAADRCLGTNPDSDSLDVLNDCATSESFFVEPYFFKYEMAAPTEPVPLDTADGDEVYVKKPGKNIKKKKGKKKANKARAKAKAAAKKKQNEDAGR